MVSQFRSTPTNDYYDGMFVSVTASIAFVHIFIALTFYRHFNSGKVFCDEENLSSGNTCVICLPLFCHPINAFYAFELLLLLSLSILNYVAGMVSAGVIWTVVCILLSILHFCFYNWCYVQQQNSQLTWDGDDPAISSFTCRRNILTFFYVIWGVGFFAFPVFQSWEGRPEPFVRWYNFTTNGELVWRGIFASYGLGFFVCILDPFHRHILFIVYVAVSGFLHAGFMLIANLYSHAHGLPNGNREHLFGDIGGWFVVAFFSAANLIGIPFSARIPSNGLNECNALKEINGLNACGNDNDFDRSHDTTSAFPISLSVIVSQSKST
jgi:hypothetical protein